MTKSIKKKSKKNVKVNAKGIKSHKTGNSNNNVINIKIGDIKKKSEKREKQNKSKGGGGGYIINNVVQPHIQPQYNAPNYPPEQPIHPAVLHQNRTQSVDITSQVDKEGLANKRNAYFNTLFQNPNDPAPNNILNPIEDSTKPDTNNKELLSNSFNEWKQNMKNNQNKNSLAENKLKNVYNNQLLKDGIEGFKENRNNNIADRFYKHNYEMRNQPIDDKDYKRALKSDGFFGLISNYYDSKIARQDENHYMKLEDIYAHSEPTNNYSISSDKNASMLTDINTPLPIHNFLPDKFAEKIENKTNEKQFKYFFEPSMFNDEELIDDNTPQLTKQLVSFKTPERNETNISNELKNVVEKQDENEGENEIEDEEEEKSVNFNNDKLVNRIGKLIMAEEKKSMNVQELRALRASEKELRDLLRENSKISFNNENFYKENGTTDLKNFNEYLNRDKKNNLKSYDLILFQKYLKFFGIKRKGMSKKTISNAIAKQKLNDMFKMKNLYDKYSQINNIKSPSDTNFKPKNKGKQTLSNLEFPDVQNEKTVKQVKLNPFLNKVETIFTANKNP